MSSVPKPAQEAPLAAALAQIARASQGQDAEAISAQAMDMFLAHQESMGVVLYAAQEEAILALTEGQHVILNTPTGSGKSLVATFAHFMAMAHGRTSYYTCPIKALVSEKFFALCRDFGAQNVGMLTGDASINRDAPIICCTAEVLANLSVSDTARTQAIDVVMDEFHYYADAARGVAWQLPLLTLERARYLLMSATLGDITAISAGIEQLTGREVAHVTSPVRPVPLDFTYAETPLTETLSDLMASNRTPIYVVHFTQRDAIEAAQALTSIDFITKEHKAQIKEALGNFRFDTPFGKHMRRFITHGIGVHHAGLLPKYRLLVEKLAQSGLLRVIMGTDTLGVGINVPIRSVLFTRLCKYDGTGTHILSVRDFKQIAGRAGRKGYDDAGSVVCQAPEHVIENLRAARRVGDDAKALRKLVKKKPPAKGYVPWDRSTFERLVEGAPEPLTSRFVIDHHLMLSMLRGHSKGYRALVTLIARAHERPRAKTLLRRRARALFVALRKAGIVRLVRNRLTGTRVVVDEALGENFSLTYALSLFLVDVLPELDRTSPTYAFDVLSLVESIMEHPGAVIARQVDRRKKEALDAMRAEGIPYEERIEALEDIEHDKPLGEFLYDRFNHWRETRPWAEGANVWPKSIAREMAENCETFVEYVVSYGLERIEGVLLRYLLQVYRALLKSVPAEALTDELVDVIAFLRDTLSRVDASLKAEWSALTAGNDGAAGDRPTLQLATPPKPDMRLLRARVRTQMHQLVRLFSVGDYAGACLFLEASSAGDSEGRDEAFDWTPERLEQAFAPYFAEHTLLDATPEGRRPDWTRIEPGEGQSLAITHTLLDAEGATAWALYAQATWSVSHEGQDLRLMLVRVGA